MTVRPLCAFALALVLAVPVAAQEPRDTLPPIVISATRSAEPVSTIANSVTVLEGEELRRAGITTVSDALRVVGAAVVQQSSHGSVTSFFLRGGQSNYVRVLVDGVPLNNPGGSLDWSTITLSNVERVEAVRGPTSVVYGSDAVTGVVQIFTRRGAGHGTVRAEARSGGYGTTDYSADVSLAGRLAGLTLGVSRGNTDGIYPYNSGHRNSTLSSQVSVTPDARSEIRLSGRWNDALYRYPTDFAGVVSDTNQYNTNRGGTVSLDAGRYFTSRLEVRALLSFRQIKSIADNPIDEPTDFPSHSEVLTDRRNADVRLNLHAAQGAVVTVGAALDQARNRSFSTFNPAGSSIARSNRAGYAQLVARRGRISGQAGVRLEDNERFGGHTTWRVGGVVHAARRTRLRANVGTAFKEPTFDENYDGAFSAGNPGLKPERSRSWEVGAEQELLGRRLTVTLGYFDQRFRDMIQYTFVPPTGSTFNYFNIAGANARGVELEIHATPLRDLQLRAQYTLLTTSVADSGFDGRQYQPGHRLIRRPTRTGSLTADYTPAGRVTGGARVLVVGSRDDLDFNQFPAQRVYLDPYYTFDLWTEVSLLHRAGGSLSLTGRVENLGDYRYAEVFGYQSAGRRLLLGARFSAAR